MPDDSSEGIDPFEPVPHNRFFEDGEEPPARYDWDDELDYLLAPNFALTPAKWYRIARDGYRRFLRQSVRYCVGYIPVWLFGLHPVLGFVLVFVEPLFLIPLTRRAIIQLSGGPTPSRDERLSIREYSILLGSNALVFLGGQSLLFGSLFVLMAIVDWCGSEWLLPAFGVATFLSLPLFIIVCRLFRFVPHLIIDKELGLFQAMRGSWRIWRGKFWAFLGMEIVTFSAQLVAVLTLFVALILVKPLSTLFWSAVYLDAIRNSDET